MKKRTPRVIALTLPVWRCKGCRRLHVERGNVAEFTDAERAEFGVSEKDQSWRKFPDVVECKKCGIQYRLMILEPESME